LITFDLVFVIFSSTQIKFRQLQEAVEHAKRKEEKEKKNEIIGKYKHNPRQVL
jgi:hypothetical protein